ncbi:hypothetical protein H0H87_008005 [Tephrocybe sp. NHM501043]|nr:hypothetical protein H0H87_008005 [Tephrocybe sp. NHM501043]
MASQIPDIQLSSKSPLPSPIAEETTIEGTLNLELEVMEVDNVFADFREDTGNDNAFPQGPTIEVSPASTNGGSDRNRDEPSNIEKSSPCPSTTVPPLSATAEAPGTLPLSTMVETPFNSMRNPAGTGAATSVDLASKDHQQALSNMMNKLSHPATPTSIQRPGTSPLLLSHHLKHTCECMEQDFDANNPDDRSTAPLGVEGMEVPAPPQLDPSLVFPANHTAHMLGAPATLTSHVPVLGALPTTMEGSSSLLTLSQEELAAIITNTVVQANPLGLPHVTGTKP